MTHDQQKHFESPLIEAVHLEDEQEAYFWTKELLEAGEDPNKADLLIPFKPLELAWWNGHALVVKILLDFGAHVEFSNDFDICLCLVGAPIEASELILEQGFDLSSLTYTNPQGDLMCDGFVNPLSELVSENKYDQVARLEPYGIMGFLDAFEQNLGRTPLSEAATTGNLQGVRWLIEQGADVNAHCESSIGYTALDNAVEFKHLEIIRSLLRAGANPNIPTWMWLTPVDHVVRYSTSPRKSRHDPDNKPDLIEIRKLVLDASKKFPKPIYPDGTTPDAWPPAPKAK